MTRFEHKKLTQIAGTGVACATNLSLFLKSRFHRKPVSARKLEKKEERLSKRLQTGEIREVVFRRADGRCELCNVNPPAEMHHLENGIGRRLQLQSVQNCVAVCMLCHRMYHHRPEDFRASVSRWAERYGFPLPSRFQEAA